MRYRVDPHSPVNIWLEVDGHDDDQVAMARTPHKAQQLVEAANLGLRVRAASDVVWALFDDWQRAHTDITCEMGYDPPAEEIENRRQALVALFGGRTPAAGDADGDRPESRP